MQHQVVDGGGSLQIWRAARNILNKQPQTANKWWSFSKGREQTTPHCKRPTCYEISHRVLELDRLFFHAWRR